MVRKVASNKITGEERQEKVKERKTNKERVSGVGYVVGSRVVREIGIRDVLEYAPLGVHTPHCTPSVVFLEVS